MNEQKCLEILKRLRAAPEEMRTGVLQELVSEAFAKDEEKPAPKSKEETEVLLVINSMMPAKPTRADIDSTLATLRNSLARATKPDRIAVLHRCVCRLRELC